MDIINRKLEKEQTQGVLFLDGYFSLKRLVIPDY